MPPSKEQTSKRIGEIAARLVKITRRRTWPGDGKLWYMTKGERSRDLIREVRALALAYLCLTQMPDRKRTRAK